VRIVLRFEDPETWIDVPEGLDQGCRPMTFTGRALDRGTVKRVVLVVFDKDTNTFWAGDQWVSDYTTVDAVLEPAADGGVNWSWSFEGHSRNNVFVGARAVDDERDFDATVASFEFQRTGSDETTEPDAGATNVPQLNSIGQ
jgi:hypothetical protein